MYYFVFGPNNSGVTAMSQYLAVRTGACLPPPGAFADREGPGAEAVRRLSTWRPFPGTDWSAVREIWDAYRDAAGKKAFVDASPANILRVSEIREAFAPDAKAVFLVSNPYMQIASCLKRETSAPLDADSIAHFAQRWLDKARIQARNVAEHPDVPLIPYELFCARPVVLDKALGLRRWPWQGAPRIAGVEAPARGVPHRPVKRVLDLSIKTLAFLTVSEVARITKALRPEATLLARFGYRLMDDDGYMARLALAPDQARAGLAQRDAWNRVA